MKKYFFLTIFLVVLSISGIVVSYAAEIIFTEGGVQVQTAPEKTWKKAKVGMQLNIGDSLQTARNSKADIVLDAEKKNSVRIEQNTLLVLNSTAPGELNKFDLSRGKIFANVEKVKAGLSFEVSTPSSVAGVRGTGWSVESEQKRDEVATFKDEVYVKTFDAQNNLISETTVPEGFKTIVERFEAASELTKVSETEMNRWNELRQEVSEHVQGRATEEQKEEPQDSNLEQLDALQETVVDTITQTTDQTQEKGTEETVQEIIPVETPVTEPSPHGN